MSGDVQPRKRKNKGKKREDAVGEEEIFIPLKNSTDEVIHVHKDIGCGGNVFTKLIFFFILATIGVMVGVILLEYRGSSDEETSSAVDSPWSVTFQDWVDDGAEKHHAPDGDHLTEELEVDDHRESHQAVLEKEHIEHTGGSSNEGDNSFFSWFSFSSDGLSKDVEEPSSEETEGFFDSLLQLVYFGYSSTQGNEEEGDESQVEEASGVFSGWFGFGEEKEVTEKEDESQMGSNEIEESEHEEKEDEHEKEVEYEGEEDEESKEDVDDIDQEEENGEDDEIEEKYDSRGQGIFNGHSNEEEEEEDDDAWNNLSQPEDDEEINDQGYSAEEEPEELDEIEKNEIESEEEEEIDTQGSSAEEEAEDLYESLKNEIEDEGIDENISSEDKRDDGSEDEEDERDDGNRDEEDERDDGNEDEGVDSSEKHATVKSSLKSGIKSDVVNTDSLEEIPNEEELFPEAREALRREREELANQKKQRKEESIDEGFAEQENEPLTDEKEEETEGMALKFGVGVALVVVAHVVLVKKWNSWAGEDPEGFMSESPLTTEWKEEVKKEVITQVTESKTEGSPPTVVNVPPVPVPVTPTQEQAEESPAEDEETGDEAEAEDEESELEIDKEKFKELIAKYGQDTPESSDVEPSDEDINKYSGGEESAADEAEEESPAEVVSEDDEPASENELKEWTGIQKSDIEKITKLDSESEGEEEPEEEEEEESDDEPPPPLPHSAQRPRGGPKDFEDLYPNDLITNEDDWAIREELDKADEEFNYEELYF